MDTHALTIDEVRRELRARGLTISGWARTQGFSQAEVYAVLNGRTKGNWGRAHKVAVALGLKAKPSDLATTKFFALVLGTELPNTMAEAPRPDDGNDLQDVERNEKGGTTGG